MFLPFWPVLLEREQWLVLCPSTPFSMRLIHEKSLEGHCMELAGAAFDRTLEDDVRMV